MPRHLVATSSKDLKTHAFIEGTRRQVQFEDFESACAHTHPVPLNPGLSARSVAAGQGSAASSRWAA